MNNNIKKLILQYETNFFDLDQTKILSKTYEERFINEIFPNEFDNLMLSNNDEEEEDEEKEENDIELTENFKKIYKKLSIKLHPDRNLNLTEEEKLYNEEIFKEVVKSYEENNFCDLLVKAREYRVIIPELNDIDINIIKNNIQKLKDEIYKFKNQMSWVWCTTNDPNIKQRIKLQCKEIIKQKICFDWKVDNIQECSICLSYLELNKIEKKLICNHIFHRTCIQSWFSIKFNCPLCRKDFD